MGLTLKQLREALRSSAIPTNPPKPRGEKAFVDLHSVELADRLKAPQSDDPETETGSADKSHTSAGGEKIQPTQGSSKINSFFKTITGQTLPPNSKKQGDLKPLGSPSRVKGIAEAHLDTLYPDKMHLIEGHDPIMVALEKIAAGKYPDGKNINGNHTVTFPNGKTVTVNRGTASSMVALRNSISQERAAKMAAHIETGPMAFLKVADFAVASHS